MYVCINCIIPRRNLFWHRKCNHCYCCFALAHCTCYHIILSREYNPCRCICARL